MLKLELTNHNILKSAFESISTIVDEIVIIADKDALHLRALSKEHITFITMELQKTLFDSYQCDTPEKMFLDAEDFYKMLKKAKNNDILEITADENEITITLKGDATRKFKLQYIDFSYDNPQPPLIDIPYHINIPSGLLKDYINDMTDFDDKLIFTVDHDYFRIIAEGQKGNAEIEYIHGENIRETVTSHFSIPKLQEILKANKFSKTCTLNIGNDMPLIIKYDLITGDGYLEYLLAPRLSEE